MRIFKSRIVLEFIFWRLYFVENSALDLLLLLRRRRRLGVLAEHADGRRRRCRRRPRVETPAAAASATGTAAVVHVLGVDWSLRKIDFDFSSVSI